MNKDQVEGRVGEAQGKVKEATGVMLDDKKMKRVGGLIARLFYVHRKTAAAPTAAI